MSNTPVWFWMHIDPIHTYCAKPRPSLVQGQRGFCGHETKRQDIEEVDQVVPLPHCWAEYFEFLDKLHNISQGIIEPCYSSISFPLWLKSAIANLKAFI